MPLFNPPLIVQEEGVDAGAVQVVNFTGDGVTASVSGDVATIAISATGGSGGGTFSQTEIDFGSVGTKSGKFVVTNASVSLTSKILANQAATAATGRSEDENEMDALVCRCVPAAGSFTVYIDSVTGYISGKYKINYIF